MLKSNELLTLCRDNHTRYNGTEKLWDDKASYSQWILLLISVHYFVFVPIAISSC